MTNSQRLATVRECFVRWIAAHRDESLEFQEEPRIESESVLIREEFYCGRRFCSSTHHAVWFIEEDELKIFKVDGGVACVLTGDEIDRWEKADEHPAVIKMPQMGRDSDDDSDQIRRAA